MAGANETNNTLASDFSADPAGRVSPASSLKPKTKISNPAIPNAWPK
jgi:hypothetical protein